MLLRPTRSVKVALAAAAALLLAAGLPAQAATTSWSQVNMTCVSGAINSYPVSGKIVTLKGWIKPCASSPADTNDFFAIGMYHWVDGVHYADTGFRTWYVPGTGTTNFSIPVDFTGYTPALCLASSPTKRLSCVNVSWVNGVATITPMATTDPKVDMTLAEFQVVRVAIDPTVKCGGCWP